jgi:hypothetical protein
LDPKLVADIRDDSTFADFRANLFEVYRGLPKLGTGQEFLRSLAQTEETLLRPVLERAEGEASHGFLYRLGIQLTEIMFSMGTRVAFDAATHDLGLHTLASEGIGVLADRVRIGREPRIPVSVWTKLYRHHRKVADELRQVGLREGSPPQRNPWVIDEHPSMNVKTTQGLLLFDDPPLPERPVPAGYSEGNYRLCDCDSGLKWKFCCHGLRDT